jgi:DnaJ-domain-containing protein 1
MIKRVRANWLERPRIEWLEIELPSRMHYARTLAEGLSVKRLREAAAKPHLKYYRNLRHGLVNKIRQHELSLGDIESGVTMFSSGNVVRAQLRDRREMLDELSSPTALLHIAEEVERQAAQRAAERAEDERHWKAEWERQWQRSAQKMAERLEREGYDPEQVRRALNLPTLSNSRALTVLGLASTATPAEIRSRYRTLALQHHPDRGGDEARMREINAAYTALRNR